MTFKRALSPSFECVDSTSDYLPAVAVGLRITGTAVLIYYRLRESNRTASGNKITYPYGAVGSFRTGTGIRNGAILPDGTTRASGTIKPCIIPVHAVPNMGVD